MHDHDLARWNLRSTPWMHRRIHADYTGWWMCLVPTAVLRDVGLSMPFFIKWDDAEFGLRAAAAGHPTVVSLPGAAVWHVPWTDKDDSTDWQAYFHARNRLVAALAHSRYDHGGRLVRESLAISVKHVLAMQYSAAALRLKAVQDVLAGPTTSTVGYRPASTWSAACGPSTPTPAPVRRRRLRASAGHPAAQADTGTERPASRLATLRAAAAGIVHQLLPVPDGATDGPQREVAAPDAGWWTLARLDSALVATADGTALAWLRRDRSVAGTALVDAVGAHLGELLRRWPELSAADPGRASRGRRRAGLAPHAGFATHRGQR